MRTALPVAALTVLFLANVVPYARSKPFWHDEIYTILLSRLPTLADTWNASVDGVDLSPPLNLWLTRAVHLVAPVGHVWTRMPAMGGFYLAMLLVFAVLRRRTGTGWAVTAALLMFFTAGFRYAAEARAYGLMMGLAALALYAWMEATAGRRRMTHAVLLFVALAASLWNHYFGVLVFAPIAAGELARAVRHRRFDPATSTAILLACVAAVPLMALLRTAAAHRATYWARPPDFSFVRQSYQFLLAPLLEPTFAAVAVLIVVAAFVRAGRPESRRSVPWHESIALTVAVLLPFLAFAVGRGFGIPVVPRYLLSTIPGFVIAIAMTLWRIDRQDSGAQTAACTCLVLLAIAAPINPDRPRFRDPVATRPLLLDSLHSPSPTVISGGVQFLEFWYYAPTASKSRMLYLADPVAAFERSGSDTIERGYLALARWTALPVEPFAGFVETHRSFRVYETNAGSLTSQLETRAALEEIGHEPGGRLYQVTMTR